MSLKIVDRDGQQYAEGIPGAQLMRSAQDVVDVIGFCFEHGVRRLLLYAEHFPDRFFDLRSGEAGELLQKWRTYGIKIAAVLSSEQIGQGRFSEMVLEENRGNDFRVFADRQDAEAWLVQD